MDNEILMVGDVASHPSETYVVIDFSEKPQNQYDNLKSCDCKDGVYQYISFSDNTGACQINFGRITDI
jgi:hypothetical protein